MRLANPETDQRLAQGACIAIKRDVNNYYRPNSKPLEGTIISCNYYGKDDGWFVELSTEEFGYSYWKQGSDGGELYIIEDGQ